MRNKLTCAENSRERRSIVEQLDGPTHLEDFEVDRVRAHHIHLPKLHQAGIIIYDSKMVFEGLKYEEAVDMITPMAQVTKRE